MNLLLRVTVVVAAVLAVCVGYTFPVSADVVEFGLDTKFSGDLPGGAAPWLTANFNDAAADAGYQVRLTLFGTNLVDDEFAGSWYFNLNPSLDPTRLVFNPVTVSAAGQVGILTGINGFQADGDGKYDILFQFPTDQSERFIGGESLVWDIKLTDGLLDASSFNFFSAPQGGEGTYLSAAHIQGIDPDATGSGWVGAVNAAPEPFSCALFLLGGGVLALRRRRK